MKITLLEDWRHEGGRVYPKGKDLDMHPTDAEELIKEKKAKKYRPGIIKQIKSKIDGNNRES